MKLNKDKGIALFTDGSSYYKDKSGGWAWVAIDCYEGLETGSGAASGTTNNRMEMQAWIEGLNSLAEALGPCQVLVYCDSEIVGRGFSGIYARKKNLDLWELLLAAANRHECVEWVWVKGHLDSLYNDMADKLAGEARKRGIPQPAVVHCKKQAYDVYIGRGSKWGNPFTHLSGPTKAQYQVRTREEAIEKYCEWLEDQPELLESLPELRGKVLGCYCAPQACHGDILMELANG